MQRSLHSTDKRQPQPPQRSDFEPIPYLLKCLLMAFVIWNISNRAFPKTGFSFSSAMISRRFFGSCSLCFLMYAHTFFATSGRDIGVVDPSTSASCGEGVKGA